MPQAIESLEADEGQARAGIQEIGAWALRRRLPSEAAHKPVIRWPDQAAELLDVPGPTLSKLRRAGDHPKLYALGRALLFTTTDDLRDWILKHEVAPGFTVRPATRRRGARGAA